MITKSEAVALPYRAILVHTSGKRCRVNGKCKTWVTRPDDFQLPVKHGLRTCFYITPQNASEWTVE